MKAAAQKAYDAVPSWLKMTLAILALMSALVSLGIVAPGWASKEEMRRDDRRLERRVNGLEREMIKANTKLDMLLEERGLKYKE